MTFPAGSSVRQADGTDQIATAPPTLTLCPVPAERPITIDIRPTVDIESLGAVERLEVFGGAPVGGGGVALIELGGIPSNLRYEGDAWRGALVLDEPLEPIGPLGEISAGSLTTVLGDFPTLNVHPPLATTSALVDPTLTEAPPVGSIATYGYDLIHRDGALLFLDEGRWPRRSAFAALLALGDPSTATVVRVTARVSMRPGSLTEIALYRQGGARSAPQRLENGESVLEIPPGDERLWLAIANPQDLVQPTDVAPSEVFALEEIMLE